MKWLNCLFLVLIFVLLVQSKDSIPENDSEETEILPPTLQLDIRCKKFELSFEVERQGGEKEGVEVLRDDKNGNMVAAPANKSEHEGIYKNTKYDASFTVNAFKNQTHHIFTYMGSFILEERMYKLMPADYNEALLGEKVEKEWAFEMKTIMYKLCLLKPPNKIVLTNDELVSTSTNGESFGDVFTKVGGEDQTKAQVSRQKNGKTDLYMEILVLIDESTYTKFARFCNNDHRATVSHLQFYYTHIMNGVSDAYERVQLKEYKLKPVVTALYVAKNKKEAPFTNAPDLKDSQGVLLTTPVLLAMDAWVKGQLESGKINWPTFDMTIMFHDLETYSELGLAYVKTVCLPLAVGMIMNTDSFESILVTAHEMGHIMGASHDSGPCLIDQQYVMTSHSSGDSGKYNNEKMFSSCSVQFYATHIADLNEMKKNCMLNKPSKLHAMDEMNNNKMLLGQKYTLNQQCALKHGHGSTYCGLEFSGDVMCGNVRCTTSKLTECVFTRNNRAYNGTSCGNRKWCIMGKCVADSKAPQFTEKKCENGDAKYILHHWTIKDLKCSMIKNKKELHNLCYQREYAVQCCETCEDIKIKTNPKDCLYGDEEYGTCKPELCVEKHFQAVCCQTCKNNSNGCYPVDKDTCEKFKTNSCSSDYMKYYCCNHCFERNKSVKKG